MWRDEGALVFNGPDEQLLSGLAAGAAGGIGGTYAAMPELYLEIFRCFKAGEMEKGREVQNLQDVLHPGQHVRRHQGDPPPSGRAGYRRRPGASAGAGARRSGHHCSGPRDDPGRYREILLSEPPAFPWKSGGFVCGEDGPQSSLGRVLPGTRGRAPLQRGLAHPLQGLLHRRNLDDKDGDGRLRQ